ncbi:MAG TPA: hypothetical protein VGK97_09280 [Spongiibacteraceae bacterium]|jgi:hypothetical protein
MLTQQEIRSELDAIAKDILQLPGMYYELYSRLFSQRVQSWLLTAPSNEAALIKRIVARDPDYSATIESLPPIQQTSIQMLFNPAWDVQY